MSLLTKRLLILFQALFLVVAIAGTCYASAESATLTVVVVVPTESNLGYTVSRGNKKFGTMDKILTELARDYSRGGRLAILFHPDVPVRSLTTMRSLASKVGYTDEDTRLLAFDIKRKGMIELTFSRQFVIYSIDPDKLEKYFSK